jgi:hypothetical protein
MRRCFGFSFALISLVAVSQTARANSQFVDLPSPTGVYEWNLFDPQGLVGFPGPHAPDVRGSNDANITALQTVYFGPISPGPGAPPVDLRAQVTSGFDLYTGNGLSTQTVNLTNAATAEANTTLVLQLAIANSATLTKEDLKLGGTTTPTDFLVLGLYDDSPGTTVLETKYIWAKWDTTAAASYAVSVPGHPHFTLRGAQLEYVNSASVASVPRPAFIPEPGSMSLAAMSLLGLACWARRRRAA